VDYLESQDWDARYRTPPRGLRGRLIEGTYRHLPNRCPICRTQNKLIKFGSKTTDYRDAPHDGNPLTIRIRRQRFKCRHCGNTFLQSIPDMDEHRRMIRVRRVHLHASAQGAVDESRRPGWGR
jgi:transposase